MKNHYVFTFKWKEKKDHYTFVPGFSDEKELLPHNKNLPTELSCTVVATCREVAETHYKRCTIGSRNLELVSVTETPIHRMFIEV